MEMWTGRVDGHSDVPDDVALVHGLTGPRPDLRHVAVEGLVAVAVVDQDVVPITVLAVELREFDGSIRRGDDRRPGRRANVDAHVVAANPHGARHAEWRRDWTDRRPDKGRRVAIRSRFRRRQSEAH